jgi:hypothetical protein
MSAPTTNVERQASNHRFPIWGIAAAVLFGALMGAAITWTAMGDVNESNAERRIDAGTGQLVETE